jgi:hypothetical protein
VKKSTDFPNPRPIYGIFGKNAKAKPVSFNKLTGLNANSVMQNALFLGA